ncbi:MAG: hypothetical protein F6K14_33295 [Symploca sp. SIO2C1]|nr:hypothetical protein [Symploca sp. SIO2C1]
MSSPRTGAGLVKLSLSRKVLGEPAPTSLDIGKEIAIAYAHLGMATKSNTTKLRTISGRGGFANHQAHRQANKLNPPRFNQG